MNASIEAPVERSQKRSKQPPKLQVEPKPAETPKTKVPPAELLPKPVIVQAKPEVRFEEKIEEPKPVAAPAQPPSPKAEKPQDVAPIQPPIVAPLQDIPKKPDDTVSLRRASEAGSDVCIAFFFSFNILPSLEITSPLVGKL